MNLWEAFSVNSSKKRFSSGTWEQKCWPVLRGERSGWKGSVLSDHVGTGGGGGPLAWGYLQPPRAVQCPSWRLVTLGLVCGSRVLHSGTLRPGNRGRQGVMRGRGHVAAVGRRKPSCPAPLHLARREPDLTEQKAWLLSTALPALEPCGRTR